MGRITRPLLLSERTPQAVEWNHRMLHPTKKAKFATLTTEDGEQQTMHFTTDTTPEARTAMTSMEHCHKAVIRLGLAFELTDLIEWDVWQLWIKKLRFATNPDGILFS